VSSISSWLVSVLISPAFLRRVLKKRCAVAAKLRAPTAQPCVLWHRCRTVQASLGSKPLGSMPDVFPLRFMEDPATVVLLGFLRAIWNV
jgi:hypothetical protein